MHALPHETRDRWAAILFTAAAASASLWDFRFSEVRIFDVASLALLLGYFLLSPESGRGWLKQRKIYIPLFAIIIAYAAFGYALHQHRSSIAIIALSLVGLHLIGRNDWLWSARVYKWLVVLHVGFFLIQMVGYRVFDAAIYFHSYDQISRYLSSGVAVKGTGLMQEANSYCLNVFVLTALSILHRSNRVLVLFAATTMMLSESLWGAGAAITLLFLNEFRNAASLKRFISMACAITLGAFAILNVYIWTTRTSGQEIPSLYSRILDIANDGSFRERYIQNSCDMNEAGAPKITADNTGAPRRIASWIFGEGLTTAHFLNCLPANGLHFLFKSFGAAGLLALFLSLGLALRGLKPRDKFFVLAALAFAFTTYPLITYVIFWIWLPALIRFAALLEFSPAMPEGTSQQRA